MNLKSRRFFNKFGGGTLAVVSVLATKEAQGGQAVLMAPPPVTLQSAAAQDDSTNNEMNVFMPSYGGRESGVAEPFKFGPVVFRPHPYYHFLYASGIQSGTNNSQSSIIQEFAPGMAVDFGRHWVLDYTPTIRFYSNRAFRNSVDHAATLSGGTSYEDWAFNLSQSYTKSDAPQVDTAAQTQTEGFDTEFGAQRELNDKLNLQLGVSQVFNFVSGLQDSRQWSTMDWLNYVYNKRLNFGVGVGGGYVMISSDSNPPSNNPDQAFEQMQARVQWRATDKLGFSVNAGLEDLQNLAPGYKDELNPTFGATIDYALFEHTDIMLAAGRTVSSSDYSISTQSTEVTSVNVTLNQRLLQEFNLMVSFGYSQTDYTVALGNISTPRTDDSYNFNVRLGHSFLKRGNVAVTYQYSDNKSSAAGFSYNSNQIGFEIGYSY